MTHDSQLLQIQRALAKGETLTTMAAMRRFGCTTLSQRCGDLCRKGWPIVSQKAKRGPHHEYFIPRAKLTRVKARATR